jgi:hypothetical protein
MRRRPARTAAGVRARRASGSRPTDRQASPGVLQPSSGDPDRRGGLLRARAPTRDRSRRTRGGKTSRTIPRVHGLDRGLRRNLAYGTAAEAGPAGASPQQDRVRGRHCAHEHGADASLTCARSARNPPARGGRLTYVREVRTEPTSTGRTPHLRARGPHGTHQHGAEASLPSTRSTSVGWGRPQADAVTTLRRLEGGGPGVRGGAGPCADPVLQCPGMDDRPPGGQPAAAGGRRARRPNLSARTRSPQGTTDSTR